MTYQEVKKLIQKGKIGIIPGWKGYLKWDYSSSELYFVNNNYRLSQRELEQKINTRNDLYYII